MRHAAWILLLACIGTAIAQQPPPVDCQDAAHRALDFWVGDWQVFDTRSDVPVATSRIDRVVGGCAIRERYHQTVEPGGKPTDYHGTSHTALDRSGTWRQQYVDSNGAVSLLSGTLRDRTLVMTADAGGDRRNRMTIRALDNGEVRQQGESSADGGATWTLSYDFTYRRQRTGE